MPSENLEKNCNHIFVKGPALTKELLEKLETDVVPVETNIFGYGIKSRRFCLLNALFLLFSTSFISTILMWTTEIYSNSIYSYMVISSDSPHFKMWKQPSITPLLKVYLFNYTNVQRYQNRLDEKLHVEEVGPYVYQEQIEKINVRFSEDGDTVSYQEKRIYNFLPELSNGTASDTIVVPNIILLSGAATVKNNNFLLRMSFSTFLKSLSQEPFIVLSADALITGYQDHLYDFSKSLMKFRNQKAVDTFGLLSARAGVQPHVITMNTGKNDIQKLGQINMFNGKTGLEFWGEEECNNIQVSDGFAYPINRIKKKQPVKFFVPQTCRTLPMVYKEDTTVLDGKVPAYRYEVPENVFDTANENSDNACFCSGQSGQCPMKGLFNVTPCSFGAPMFYSLPHFHRADKQIQNGVTGLEPDNKPYVTYANIHPTMGFIISGKTYLQANVQVQKSFGISEVSMFEDGVILPIVWMEGDLDETLTPKEFLDVIYQATFLVPALEKGLKFGSLLTTIVTFTCIILVVRKMWLQRSEYV